MHYNDQGADFKYLIVNERDKRFGLSVTTVGFQAIRAGAFIHHATTRTLIISRPRKDVCCMNISWYTLLKDGELSPAILLRLSTYLKDRYFSCFPDSGIPTRRCKNRMERILHRF
mgnify:CR=1 FL=1